MPKKITLMPLYFLPLLILGYAFYLFNIDTYQTNKYPYDLMTTINYFAWHIFKIPYQKVVDLHFSFAVSVFFVYSTLFSFSVTLIFLLIRYIKRNSYSFFYIHSIPLLLSLLAVCLVGAVRFYTGGGNCGFFLYNCKYNRSWEMNDYGHMVGVHEIVNANGTIVPSRLKKCEFHGKIHEFDTLIMKLHGVRILYDSEVIREYVFANDRILRINKNKQPIEINIEPFSFELNNKVKNLLYQGTTCGQTFEEQIFVYENPGSG